MFVPHLQQYSLFFTDNPMNVKIIIISLMLVSKIYTNACNILQTNHANVQQL